MRSFALSSYFVIAYFVISFLFVLYLIFQEKPKNKIICLAVAYWVLTFNFYKSYYMWYKIPYLWYFRQADFYFAWFLAVLMIFVRFSSLRKEKALKIKQPFFEKYLYIYIFFTIFMLGLHTYLGNTTFYKGTTFIRLYFDGFLIYYCLKYFMTREMIKILIKTVIFMGVISSVASIIQFFINDDFLRIGIFHFAYPGHNRSSGIFYYPYDNGIFTILSLFTTAYLIDNWRIKVPLITLFIINLFLVFTRGTWIAFGVVLLFHLLYFYRKEFGKIIFNAGIITILLTVINQTYFSNKDFFSGEYTERVKSDTVTVRMAFYAFVLKAIPDKPFIGYGDVENNPIYFKGMANAEQTLLWALGKSGGIHNLFLEEAFLRGIFAPIFLSIAFIAFFVFSIKQAKINKNYLYCLPAYFNLGFFLYFMSVSGFLISRSGMLSLVMFAIISGIYYNKINLSEITIKTNFDKGSILPKETI